MDKSIAFFRMTKIDEAKRIVYGRAVQEIPDRAGEIFDYESSKPYFEEWSKSQSEASLGKSAGNIRAMHKDVSAGIVVPGGLIFHDDEKAIDIIAHVTDDNEWKKVETGTYTGFSIGGSYVKKWEDTELKKTRYTANPSETSLVDRPCGPTSTFFEVQKADGTTEKREFAKPEGDQAVIDAGLELARQQLAKANGDGTIAGFDRNKAISELLMKGQTMAIADLPDVELQKLWKGDAGQQDATDATKTAAEPVKTETETTKPATEVTKTDAPTFDRKAAIEYLLAKGQKIEDLATMADADLTKIQDVAKADDQEVDDVEVKGAPEEILVFGKMMNKAGLAMGDVIKMVAGHIAKADAKPKYGSAKFADEANKKYPIDTSDQTKAAAAYWSVEKNQAKYSDDEKKVIGANIAAAQKEFGVDKIAKADVLPQSLVKGLYSCSRLADLLESLCYLSESVEYEASYENDGSEIPARLNDCFATLGQVLVDMVQEEVDEAVKAKTGDVDVQILAMADAAKDLVKRCADLEKAGARNSKKDQSSIQKVHDHAVELGAACKAAEKMAKADTVDGALAKQLSESNDALQKAIGTANEVITKLTADVAMLKAQPMPTTVRLMAVGKGMDVEELNAPKEVEPVRKQDGTIDEVATAMKKVQQTGGRPLIGG